MAFKQGPTLQRKEKEIATAKSMATTKQWAQKRKTQNSCAFVTSALQT